MTGKRPVWLVYIFPVSVMVAKIWFVISLFGSCGGSFVSVAWFVVGVVGWDRVLRMFFRVWSMCPFVVASNCG